MEAMNMNIKSSPEYKEAMKVVEKMINTKIKPLQERIAHLEKALQELRQEKPNT